MANPTPLPPVGHGATLAAVYPRRVMKPILVSKRELRTLSLENFLALFLMSAGFGGITFAIGIVVDWLMQDMPSSNSDVMVQVLAPIIGGFGVILILTGIIVLLYRRGDIENIEGETEYPYESGEAVVLTPSGVIPSIPQTSGGQPEPTLSERP